LSCYHLIIVGERHVEQNQEAIIHNIQSLYPFIKTHLIDRHQNVIDLTASELYSNGDLDFFQRDLHLIHKATLNISFGIGGPLHILKGFGRTSWFFIGDNNSWPVLNEYKQIDDGDRFYRDIHTLMNDFELGYMS